MTAGSVHPPITAYLIVLLVAIPLLGAVSAAPVIAARHWWGEKGLWGAAVIWWGWLGGTIIFQEWPRLRQSPDEFAVVLGLLLAWAVIPAYLIDRGSRGSRMPPVWKRIAYGIGGLYAGTALVFLVALVLVVLAAVLRKLGVAA